MHSLRIYTLTLH